MKSFIPRWIIATVAVIVTVPIFFLWLTRIARGPSRPPIRAEAFVHCQGNFKGRQPTSEEMNSVLKRHYEWLRSGGRSEDPRRANLCGAILTDTSLRADMRGVSLSVAMLMDADLSGSNLFGANLTGADLIRTHLNGVDLNSADLRGAVLAGADLSGAHLLGADLDSVTFEPDALPDIGELAFTRNLSSMTFALRPHALVKLRNAFKEGGYYQAEREITYAINHTQVQHLLDIGNPRHVRVASLIAGLVDYVLFELTTRWGMVPERSLMILLAMIPVFAVPYSIGLSRQGKDGIWRTWADDRLRTDLGTNEPAMPLCVGHRQAFGLGLQFSVISAFSIGWRELNVGNWIQRLQRTEYTLRATGWLRTVSGAQSLLSVYLLAIWVLTRFGRPFE